MNKADLINEVMTRVDLGKAESTNVVAAVFDAITDTLKKGDQVAIAGFGIFQPKEREARKGRNPKTGETIDIPASKALSFKPAKALKDALNA